MQDVTFSIIVVSLNAEKTMGITMDSILGQTCSDYEVIVKDGKSRDNTLNIIPKDERIRVYSQKDKSVYDAMNQALDYVKGCYVIFMNCGDTFYNSDVLKQVKEVIRNKNLCGQEVLYGNYAKDGQVYTQSPVIDKKYLIKSGLCHQTVFFGKGIFDKVGKFDDSMRICADYEIMVRAFVAGYSYVYINEVICNYLGGGLSEMQENLPLVKKEGKTVRTRYFSVSERSNYFIKKVIDRIIVKRG